MDDHGGITRTTDSKGRITLGEAFANRTVILEEREGGEFVLRLARVIPERESWLYENPESLALVRRGLKEARERKFVKGPNLDRASRLASRAPGADE